MSNSKLATYTKISPNKNVPRNHEIDTISIHCTAGNVNNTAKQIANFNHFTNANLKNSCSCNYAIGGDGSIALIVEEKDRSWCTSSSNNDHRAVTIEVASANVHPYKVTDKAFAALIDLVTDICKRNGIKELKWKADKSLIGKVDKQNLTVHRWFANKACPGDHLYNLHDDIAKSVNNKLGATSSSDSSTSTFKVKVTVNELNIRAGASTNFKITGTIKDKGVYTIVEESNGWGKLKSGTGWISLAYTKRV